MEDCGKLQSRWSNGSGSSIDFGGGVADLSGQVHRLPCSIKFNGPSDVSPYFKPKPTGVENEGLPVEKAYFRGRELLGTTLPLPAPYSGFVIAKKNSGTVGKEATDNDSDGRWEVNAKFASLTFWNHDSHPSQDDTSLRSLHWLTVANALHKPVTAEDLADPSAQQ